MKSYAIPEYRDAGCPFLEANVYIFITLWRKVEGKICDTGCSWFKEEGCASYKKLIKEKPKSREKPEETVKQMAQRLGISISEVRRRRQGV